MLHLFLMTNMLWVGLQASQNSDDDMELLLVQAMWRHGDRSPTKTYKKDRIQEANWTFGGGGFGQLSPIGMSQMLSLGFSIRGRYINSGFLSRKYSSKEIYIRSTDTNRTIASAMIITQGMYGGTGFAGTDYPKSNWPASGSTYNVEVGIPDGPCNRRVQLWKMAEASPEVQEYKNSKNVSKMLKFLEEKSGETIHLDDVHVVRDPLFIEIHFKDKLKEITPWLNDSVYNEINRIYDQTTRYLNGLFDKKIIVNGVDIGLELMRIRGGAFINELVRHMNHKFDCQESNETECKWMKGLKLYAYSVMFQTGIQHDSTISQLFAIMGIERKVIIPGVYPEYAAAAFIELWRNKTDEKPYFRILYKENDGVLYFKPVTHTISECGGKEYCSLEVFENFAKKVEIYKPVPVLCEEDPNKGISWSAAWLQYAFIVVAGLLFIILIAYAISVQN